MGRSSRLDVCGQCRQRTFRQSPKQPRCHWKLHQLVDATQMTGAVLWPRRAQAERAGQQAEGGRMEARQGRDKAVTRRLGSRQPSAKAAHQTGACDEWVDFWTSPARAAWIAIERCHPVEDFHRDKVGKDVDTVRNWGPHLIETWQASSRTSWLTCLLVRCSTTDLAGVTWLHISITTWSSLSEPKCSRAISHS